MISFPFSPFQYSFELESRESKITISKPSFTLQVTVNSKWKCRNCKAGGQEKFRMHRLKTMRLFSSSSKCFVIILITDLVALLHKDHLLEINQNGAICFKWTCNQLLKLCGYVAWKSLQSSPLPKIDTKLRTKPLSVTVQIALLGLSFKTF